MAWLSPEDQHALYQAVRDGDVEFVAKTVPNSKINLPPFSALWHEPGEAATCLHLAVCCIQPAMVAHLLACGADPSISAGKYTTMAMLSAFDLFAPARAQRPQDLISVQQLLEEALKKLSSSNPA